MGPGRDPLFFIAARSHGRSSTSERFGSRRWTGRAAPHRGRRRRNAHRTHRRAGPARSWIAARAGQNLGNRGDDGPDHGRAAGRIDVDRRLRARERRALAGVRRRGHHDPGLSARALLPRHRPAAGPAIGFRAGGRRRGADRDGDRGRWTQAIPRRDRGGGGRARRAGRAASGDRRRSRASLASICRSATWARRGWC